MQHFLERRFQVPANAPPRLIEDIEAYSAFVELQERMRPSAPWYPKLS